MHNPASPRTHVRAGSRLAPLLLAIAGLLLAGCWDSDDNSGGNHTDAPILTADNDCWKSWTCDGCHTLPVDGHTETQAHECARCHGGNGALDPNHPASGKYHQMTEPCLDCHIMPPSYAHPIFDESYQCARCHFAVEGVDPG